MPFHDVAERPFRQYDFTRRSIRLIGPGRRLTDDKQEQRHQQRAKTWIFHIKSRPVPTRCDFTHASTRRVNGIKSHDKTPRRKERRRRASSIKAVLELLPNDERIAPVGIASKSGWTVSPFTSSPLRLCVLA